MASILSSIATRASIIRRWGRSSIVIISSSPIITPVNPLSTAEERKNRENHKYNKSDDIAVSNINEANINAQFETKMTLIKFIRKMWQNGLILENAANGTNTTEKEMITYIRQNYAREISLQEFGMQFHLSEKYISRYFKEHFHTP